MIQFLILQIKLGKITVDDVPEKFREAIMKQLEV